MSRAATEPSEACPRDAGPTTSVRAAVARRAARATAKGRRSDRSGSVAPHSTSAQRMRSSVGVSGHGPRSGAVQSPAFLGLPEELGHLFEAARQRQLGGGPAAVDRAALLVELRHRGSDGGQAGSRLTTAPAPRRQTLDLAEIEEAAAPGGVRMGIEQAAADVGVQRRHLDPEAAGGLLRGQHAVHQHHLTLT